MNEGNGEASTKSNECGLVRMGWAQPFTVETNNIRMLIDVTIFYKIQPYPNKGYNGMIVLKK